MKNGIEREITELLRDVVWNFGSQGIDGQCCGNLSAAEMRALRTAAACQECSMQDLAKALGFTKSGATRVVDRLENKKLVRRARSAADGRICCAEVTAAGRKMIARFNQDAQQQVAQVLDNMDPAMQKVLKTALQALVAAV